MINKIPLILNSSQEQLRSLDHVEGLIKEFGLYRDDRNLYGDPYNSWQNDGPGIWQQPRQLAQALIWLSDNKIGTYLDVGTFYGYTFTFICAYLSKFDLKSALAMDSNQYFTNFKEAADQLPIPIAYSAREGPIERQGHENYTRSQRGESFDLVFIDANHNYSAIAIDYENVGKYARYCAFHDVNDEYIERECEGKGAVGFWEDLCLREENNKNIMEFICHPDNKRIMGLGIIEQ